MFGFKRLKTFLITAFMMLMLSYPVHAGYYAVQKNDTLNDISNLFNTSVYSITRDNNISGYTIYPGQALWVPSDAYTVKSGDTLYLIAKNRWISVYSIKKANNIWYNNIYTGQKLNLPRSVSKEYSQPVITYTAQDLDLLARLIMAEAESQPYTAKVGVGAVVVNRVQSPEWPNSIWGVINQKIDGYYQFTPVENGWIKRAASQESIKAAYAALYGKDPTNGAIFYFDDSTTNKWIWSRPLSTRIGRLVFTY